jgi:hypothetical protein
MATAEGATPALRRPASIASCSPPGQRESLMENQRLERQGETGRAHSRSKVETLCWRALAGWLLELCWALLVEGLATGTALAQKIPALRLNAREIGGQSLLALAPLTPHSQESQNPRLSQPACFLLQLVCRPRTRLASHAPVEAGQAGRQAGRTHLAQ